MKELISGITSQDSDYRGSRGDEIVTRRDHEGDLWVAGVVLIPDLNTGCRDGITLWNSLSCTLFIFVLFSMCISRKKLIKILI